MGFKEENNENPHISVEIIEINHFNKST